MWRFFSVEENGCFTVFTNSLDCDRLLQAALFTAAALFSSQGIHPAFALSISLGE